MRWIQNLRLRSLDWKATWILYALAMKAKRLAFTNGTLDPGNTHEGGWDLTLPTTEPAAGSLHVQPCIVSVFSDWNTGGLPTDCSKEGAMLVPLSQNDPIWKDDLLGTHPTSTIGNYGCVLTACTMICNHFGKVVTVTELNQIMTNIGGYSNDSYWIWSKLTEVFPSIHFDWVVYHAGECAAVDAPLHLLDALLECEIPALVKVAYRRASGVQGFHYVLVVGLNGNDDYIIYDPWDGQEKKFQNTYKNPARSIYHIMAYRQVV